MENPPIILIGCHRSGTSLLSQILQQSGVHMGLDQNDHAESRQFLQINDRIFAEAGATWDSPEALVARLADSAFRQEAVAAARQATRPWRLAGGYAAWSWWRSGPAGQGRAWGWKDPRNTITLPIWLNIFPGGRVVHLCRNGVDVALSLQRREQQRRSSSRLTAPKCLGTQGAFQVWRQYEQLALDSTAGLAEETCFRLRYEDLLSEPGRQIRRLLAFLGIPDEGHRFDLDVDRAYAFAQHAQGRSFFEQARRTETMRRLGYDRWPGEQ